MTNTTKTRMARTMMVVLAALIGAATTYADDSVTFNGNKRDAPDLAVEKQAVTKKSRRLD